MKKKTVKRTMPRMNTKKGLIVLTIAAVLAAIGLIGVRYEGRIQQIKTDRADLQAFDRELNEAGSQIFPGIEARITKKCYHSEQGPWDNGNLWCSVGYTYNLGNIDNRQIAASLESERDEYSRAFRNFSFRSNGAPSPWTYNEKALTDLNGVYGLDQTFQMNSRNDPIVCEFNGTSKNPIPKSDLSDVTITVSCAKRAAEVYFTEKDYWPL